MIEIVGKIVLIIACLFMAGLNLWLEFKDWFSKRYQRKDKTGDKKQEPKPQNEGIPDIIGKSKFNLKDSIERKRLEESIKTKPIASDKDEENNNTPFHSMDLEKKENPLSGYTGVVSSEDEIIVYSGNEKIDVALNNSQSVTMNEFELLAKTLQGNPIQKDEEKQIPEILQRVQGTNLYEQFIGQVNGAEAIAGNILRLAEIDSEMDNNNNSSNTGNLSKFIRT